MTNNRLGAIKAFRTVAYACLASAICFSSPVYSAQKTSAQQEAVTAAFTTNPSPRPDVPPVRELELVVVWGFRLRTTEHDLRVQSVRGGYSELIEKAVCLTSICGFVVVQDGSKWRTTNVVSATQDELQEMERNMERENTILVIVHPTGQKRTVPEF